MAYMLRSINGYLILTGFIALIILLRTIIETFQTTSVPGYFLLLLMLASVVWGIYTNAVLLFKKDNVNTVRYLKYNLWYNILQAGAFSLFGFVYVFSMGVEVIPYVLNDGNINIGCRFDLFNVKASCYYNSEESVYFLGINLVPLLIAVFLNHFINKTSGKQSKS